MVNISFIVDNNMWYVILNKKRELPSCKWCFTKSMTIMKEKIVSFNWEQFARHELSLNLFVAHGMSSVSSYFEKEEESNRFLESQLAHFPALMHRKVFHALFYFRLTSAYAISPLVKFGRFRKKKNGTKKTFEIKIKLYSKLLKPRRIKQS